MQRQFHRLHLVALAACSTTAPPEAVVMSASIAVGASPAPPIPGGPPRSCHAGHGVRRRARGWPRAWSRRCRLPCAGFCPIENTERWLNIRDDNPGAPDQGAGLRCRSTIDTGSYATVRRMLRQGVTPAGGRGACRGVPELLRLRASAPPAQPFR